MVVSDPKDPASQGDPAEEPEPKETPEPAVKPEQIVLTQTELDRIVQDRTAQARRKATESADKAKRWDEYVASQQTEAEKAEAERKTREEAFAQREAAVNAKLLRATALEAVREGKVDPDLEDFVIDAVIRSEGVEVSEKGEVTGVKEALAALLKARPKLVVSTGSKSGDGGFTGGDGKTLSEKIAAAKTPTESIPLKLAQMVSGK